MRLKKGNTATLRISITDSAGTLVTNLATATAVKFMMKNNNKDLDTSAVVSKSLGNGITVDDPSAGIVTVALASTDLNITPKAYYAALQLEFVADINEVNLSETNLSLSENPDVFDRIEIYQDVIENP